MHRKRVIVALVLVPLFYAYVKYLPAEYFLFLLVFLSTLALMEFYSMFAVPGPLKYTGIGAGAFLLAVYYTAGNSFPDALLLCTLLIMGARLITRREPTSSLREVGAAVLGILYIPCLLSFQLNLVRSGPDWIILLYASVWVSDSMAYYIGKSFGKRKLFVEVSPNKTVAGAVGSVIGGCIGAVVIRFAAMSGLSLLHAVLIGLSVGGACVMGDLVESMFKRDAGVKDSSNVIPGHGGVLDKIDSVTFAGPVFYWLCSGLRLL